MKRDQFIKAVFNKYINLFDDLLKHNPKLAQHSINSQFDKNFFISYQERNAEEELFLTVISPSVYNKIITLIDREEDKEEFNKLIKNIKKLY